MRMNDKIKTLKEKLQKMKVNRGNRQTGQMFHFSPFSKKQKQGADMVVQRITGTQ